MMRKLFGVACVALIACARSASAQTPLDNVDQKCVNAMNKDTSQIQAAKGKLDAGCVNAQEKRKLPSASGCISADAHQKVSKAVTKIGTDNTKHCSADTPPFAYTSPGTASGAATTAEANFLQDMVGSPTDSGLFDCQTQPAQCACQLHVIPRAENLLRTLEAEFIRCKVAVLAVGKTGNAFPMGAATSGADVSRCITDGSIPQSVQADPKQAFQKAQTLLQGADSKFCTAGGEFSSGVCGATDGAPLDNCLAQRAKCRFCLMANDADNLGLSAGSCAAWSGGTCP
jgi:hypothetical protein